MPDYNNYPKYYDDIIYGDIQERVERYERNKIIEDHIKKIKGLNVKPRNNWQLFLEDLQKLPTGISLDLMSFKCKLKTAFFPGISCINDRWRFNSKIFNDGFLWSCGCMPREDSTWERDNWIIISDNDLRLYYENQRTKGY